jgi:ATP-dependent helicase STH1/SNF2
MPGSKRMPRLMQESELPEIYMSDGNPISDEPEEIKGRGARERTRVKYDDGLTEEQWLMAVDDDEDSPEAAAARKAARKERREKKRLGQDVGSGDDSAGSRGSSEEPEPEPEPTPKKGKGRKAAAPKVEKRKAEEVEDEPPAKRKRAGGPGRGKGKANGDILTPQVRAVLQKSLHKLYKAFNELESPVEPSSGSESDDEPESRLIIGPFLDMPSKRDYADYYTFTKEPIAMKVIEKKINKAQYSSLADLQRDMNLLCSNATAYNEEASMIHQDALSIQASTCN